MATIKGYNDWSNINWANQSYDEFCDILEDCYGLEIKRK